MKHGMIIAFDDYFCWSPSQTSGERLAVLEHFNEGNHWSLVEFMRFSWAGLAYAVEDRLNN